MIPLSQLTPMTSPVDDNQLRALRAALKGMSPTQIAWVSGYLAGLGAVGSAVTDQPLAQQLEQPTLLILFGSQTGNAQGVAEQLGELATRAELHAKVVSMADYNPRSLARETFALLVVSTHGDGEPPENALALHRFLHGDRPPRLSQLRYAVLGLGDSSYEHFCQTAIELDQRLDQLGAQRFAELRRCDIDYEADSADWSRRMLEKVAELVPDSVAVKRSDNVVPLPSVSASPRLNTARVFSKTDPYPASLVENRRITTGDAVADVRHLVLMADARGLDFEPGDALGVWPKNDPALVDAVLSAAGLGSDAAGEPVGDGQLPLRQALVERLELTLLHPATVQAWAERCGATELSSIVADPARLRRYASERQFIDLIEAFPAPVDAKGLAGMLRPLQPRLYSIASSRDQADDEIHLTVSVVRYRAGDSERRGAASAFLAERLGAAEPVGVYVVSNPSFRLPADSDTPIIMIGAGTGVAPYRAFLQRRAATGARGRNWLVFGNRHFHRDFLYQTDWQAQRKAGLLQRVSLAFSRDLEERVYVQHRLRDEGAELFRWLEEGAHVYVCGATRLGQDVHQALLDVIAAEGRLTPEDAASYTDHLRQQARYHRDLY